MNSFLSCNTNSNEFLNNALGALSNRISSLKTEIATLQQNQIAPNNLAIYLQNFTVSSTLLQNNWNVVGIIPSNVTGHRVWQFSSSFNVTSSSQDFSIVYDFSNVVSNYNVSFEGTPSGTISYDNQVLNANEYCTITQQGDFLYFQLSGLPSGVNAGSELSYIINFNDTTQIGINWTQTYINVQDSNQQTCGGNAYNNYCTINWNGSYISGVAATATSPAVAPTYTITITNSFIVCDSNPYYEWIMSNTWYTDNESYFQNVPSGTTNITVYFINNTGTNNGGTGTAYDFPKSSLQFKFTNYEANGYTYKLNSGNYQYNDGYSVDAGGSTNFIFTYTFSS